MERATGTEVYGCGSPQTTDITLNIQTTTGGNFSVILNGKHTVEHLKKLVSKKLKVSKDRICLLHRERQLRDGTLEDNGLLDGSRVILLPSVETGLLSQRPENSVMQALESLNDTQVNDFLSGKSPLNLTMRLGDNMMLIQLQLSTLNSATSSSSRSLRTTTPNISSASTNRTKCDATDSPSPQSSPEKAPQTLEPSVENETNKNDKQTHVFQFEKQDWEMLQNAFDLYRLAEEKYADRSDFSENKDVMDSTNSNLSDLADTSLDSDQSPIKSLSNLVSSPIVAATSDNRESIITNSVKNKLIDLLTKSKEDNAVPSTSAGCEKPSPTSSTSLDSSLSDDSDNFADQSSFLSENTIDEYPMENLFNSAVDKGLFEDQDDSMMDREISNLVTTNHGTEDATNTNTGNLPSFQSINEPLKNKRFQYLLHKTSKFKHPIRQNKQKAFMQSVVNKHKKRMQIRQDNRLTESSTLQSEPYITNSRKLILQPSSEPDYTVTPSTSKTVKMEHCIMAQSSTPATQPNVDTVKKLAFQPSDQNDMVTPSTSKQLSFVRPDAPKKPQRASPTPFIDTKALREASKNLTQKLKKLSKEVLTNKIDLRTAEESVRSKIGPGAVIESMKHHGKGIYSGTFSGTLNPALQDRYGRPKRDISTIIHILNDLLCAAPPIALAQKDAKHSCSTSTSEEPKKCLGCSQPSCSYGQCDGHLPSTSTADGKLCSCNSDCECTLQHTTCTSCSTLGTSGYTCKKCDTAKTLAMENSKTKCKLEQLRLVMQQKKQRREARKLKTLPYTTSPSKTIASPDQTSTIQEEIETVA